MISLVEFLNSKSSLNKQYEEELISILDKLDVGNVELLSNEEFQFIVVKLMSLASSNKISDETKEAIIDKLDEIEKNLTLIVQHLSKQKGNLEKKVKISGKNFDLPLLILIGVGLSFFGGKILMPLLVLCPTTYKYTKINLLEQSVKFYIWTVWVKFIN